jgi:aminoglycoside phosphotransferase (APT) family kinase protein
MTSVTGSQPLATAVSGAVVAAVAAELTAIGRELTDPAAIERLSLASSLLSWLDSDMAIDRERLADARARLEAVRSHRPTDQRELSAAIHEVLRAQGRQARHSDEVSTPVAPPIPTAAEVTAYLDARRSGDRADSVKAIVGGFSKVTLLVSGTIDGQAQDIVLRQIPAGRKAASLAPEYAVVEFVHRHRLPVPRPLWIEFGDNALGGAFFATAKASGANIGDVWGQRGASKQLCLEVADFYARLHQLPVDDLTAPVSPRSSPGELRAMIAWQRDVLAKRGISVEPVLGALLDWLEEHIPVQSPRRSLIHGDAAFSNLLVDGDRITAVLDWEAAHVGDAADELSYLKPSIEPVMPWSDFLDRYVTAGGLEPAPESMKFFEVWSHVWRHIGCLWLAQNFEQTGRYASAVAAYVHGPRFLAEGVKAAFS